MTDTLAPGAVESADDEAFDPREHKLVLDDLETHFSLSSGILDRLLRGEERKLKAVDGVSLGIREGEVFGLAGESGCGKTTLGKTAIRLQEPTAGNIYFDGEDITDIGGDDLTAFRRQAQIIHQDPYESLNPRFRVRRWVREPLVVHDIGDDESRDARVFEVLEKAGLEPPGAYIDEFPAELSGGERQRVSIARALAIDPSFLVGDEPTSMLDVSIRANVLDDLRRLQEESGLTALYISHDISMLKYICDRIGIMYLGKLVEVGPAEEVIADPKHPYTQALVSSIPRLDPTETRERVELAGEVPDPIDVPSGCRFHPRCPKVRPPAGYEFAGSEYRAVASLRRDLLANDLSDSEALADADEITERSVREVYGIPQTLGDEDAEEVLSAAIDARLDPDSTDEAALDRLEREFESVCTRGTVPTVTVGPDHRVDCVLYEPDESNS